ncbi:cathelicidin antimicrobial peptide isoform X1 [Sarcophilus harrisii]|uniref:Cathelicidin antimicrobial peptide n=1 Tax=Sarcophilus harrisii TaxID=9305 RepID=G3VCM7_SARHA|nr:cathelicidin antimicrobial peptide isoform X1 [Sarcophilus harrisii]
MRMQKVSNMQIFLLILGLLSLTPLAPAQDQRYQELVNRFIREYNRNSGSENLFRLSILNLPPGEDNDPPTLLPLSFTIAETVCPNSENRNPDECDFRENGVVKECVGTIALDSAEPSVDISCDGPGKMKRMGIFHLFWAGLRKLGNLIKNKIQQGIENFLG